MVKNQDQKDQKQLSLSGQTKKLKDQKETEKAFTWLTLTQVEITLLKFGLWTMIFMNIPTAK